jgi:hypothetical protein
VWAKRKEGNELLMDAAYKIYRSLALLSDPTNQSKQRGLQWNPPVVNNIEKRGRRRREP